MCTVQHYYKFSGRGGGGEQHLYFNHWVRFRFLQPGNLAYVDWSTYIILRLVAYICSLVSL